jgi:ABC-type Fe3+/spermidine/putrescine transport system ATPase subunit
LRDTFLRLSGLDKKFGDFHAVRELSIDVAEGEVLTFLGPSGCGKTTTLRMIAGLESPDRGAIYLGGDPLVSIERGINHPPERRGMGMVFQSYAIWPNMTVGGNVAFPLKIRRLGKTEIRERVLKALKMVGLEQLVDRPATALSGGQQQRVALARALVYEPQILLLDEPLSNLDVKLREQMRVEIKLLQNRLGLTVIYVTHDQAEALGLSDRIAMLNEGRIEQIGPPHELYERPQTRFVRDFLGKSVRLFGRVRQLDNLTVNVELDDANGASVQCRPPSADFTLNADVEVSIRPESVGIDIRRHGDTGNAIDGIVQAVLYQGERSECEVRIGRQSVLVYAPPQLPLKPGDTVSLTIPPDAASIWQR